METARAAKIRIIAGLIQSPAFLFEGIMFRAFTFIFFMTITTVFAQLGIDLDYSNSYTSNTFYNYKSLPDNFHSIDAYSNYDWTANGKGLRLAYNLQAHFFNQYTDRNSHSHTVGTSYYLYSSKHRFNGGLDVSKRANSDAYKYYERSQVLLFNHFKYVFSTDFFGYIGGKFYLRNYDNLDVFSYFQTDFYVRLSKFFNTGTTLILQVNYLTKSYLQDNPSSPIETLPDLVTLGNGTSSHLQTTVRAAQSIGTSLGLSGQFSLKKSLSTSSRYLGSPDSYYYSDDEIFNDRFGYESAEFSLKLKKKIKRWIATVGYGFTKKNYTQRLALDLEGYALPGDPLRKDTRSTLWGTLGYHLKLAKQPTMLSLDIMYLNNESNDSYYTYSNRFISLGINQNF